MRTLAIGDLQGCYTPFRKLLDTLHFDPASDRLWLTGDLVNRGPESLEVLRFVKSLGDAAITVLGNHDLYLLMVANGFGKRGKDDTLDPILDAPDREELLTWLRQQPLLHVADINDRPHALVHAGLLPQWSLGRARQLAGEVESALRGAQFGEFLDHLWGSQPAAWDETLRGWDRLRIVVNAMTRMRFCTPEGVMEFHSKGELGNAPAGHLPWFDADNRQHREGVIVCGHWSALGLLLRDDVLALDTGCLWGQSLTALCLETRHVTQIDCPCAQTLIKG